MHIYCIYMKSRPMLEPSLDGCPECRFATFMISLEIKGDITKKRDLHAYISNGVHSGVLYISYN